MDKQKSMIAAVTGPSGHVGANLVRHLIDDGWTVRALVHDDEKGIEGLDVERYKGDLLNRQSLEQCFHGVDVVFNLAGRISIEGDPGGHVHKTNVEGTKNVVEACLACHVKRLIHFSSIHAFNPIPLDEEVDESRGEDDRPTTAHYNRSKVEGEHEVRKGIDKGLDAVILNPTSIIGPYDFAPSLMGETFLKLYQGELTALSAGGFDFVDVRDVCQAAIAAVDYGKKGENYLIAGQWLSVKELAQKVKKVKGVKVPRFALPFGFLYAILPFVKLYARITNSTPLFTKESLATLQEYRQVSYRKAKDELGYQPRPIEDSISDIYDWFEQYGFLKK